MDSLPRRRSHTPHSGTQYYETIVGGRHSPVISLLILQTHIAGGAEIPQTRGSLSDRGRLAELSFDKRLFRTGLEELPSAAAEMTAHMFCAEVIIAPVPPPTSFLRAGGVAGDLHRIFRVVP